MKRFSWEIVLTGLVFVFIAIYLMGRPSDTSSENDIVNTDTPSQTDISSGSKSVQIINLESLEELKKLEELDKLKGLGKLETLSSLKEMADLIPAEAREEFLMELDLAIQELNNEGIEINLNLDDNIIVLNRNADIVEGTWVRTEPGIYIFKNEFSAAGVTSVSAILPGGNITIVGTKDSTSSFTLQASGQINNDDQLFDLISPNSTVQNGELTLTVGTANEFSRQNIQLQATMYVPENIMVTGTTKAGHIEITNIHGDQVYETGGGHVKLHKVSGNIIAVTKGGHMWSDEGSGELTFNSTGGHLTITKFAGDVSLKTAGGNILAEEVDGEINCSTSGGNIEIRLIRAGHDITAETSAGNILMTLPETLSADVDLKGSNGVEVTGYTLTTQMQTRNSIKGEINGGGPDIVAYTKYGNVAIKSND